MSNARIPFVMAQDGWVPRRLVRVSPRFGTPVLSLVLCSALYAVMSNDSFTNLPTFDVLLTNLTILGELAALIALRIKEPHLPRPYRIPGGWFGLALISVPLTAAVVWAAWSTLAEDSSGDRIRVLLCLAASVLLYFPCRHLRRRRLAAADAASLPASAWRERAGFAPGSLLPTTADDLRARACGPHRCKSGAAARSLQVTAG